MIYTSYVTVPVGLFFLSSEFSRIFPGTGTPDGDGAPPCGTGRALLTAAAVGEIEGRRAQGTRETGMDDAGLGETETVTGTGAFFFILFFSFLLSFFSLFSLFFYLFFYLSADG